MFNKSVPDTVRTRKVERIIIYINGNPIKEDNHIIGVMRVWRYVSDHSYFAHRGVMFYYISK